LPEFCQGILSSGNLLSPGASVAVRKFRTWVYCQPQAKRFPYFPVDMRKYPSDGIVRAGRGVPCYLVQLKAELIMRFVKGAVVNGIC
jgi:hypothetical protein